MVGLWVMLKSDSLNDISAFEEGLPNAVHTIHHRAIGGQDDRTPQIGLLNQLDMGEHRTPCWTFALTEPCLVKFANLKQRHLLPRKIP